MPLRIVIPGGTGQIGVLLARHFHEQNHSVAVIARYPKPREWETVHWEPESLGPWSDCLEGADAVINLAGRSVNCRYTATHRQEILHSRVGTTELIGRAISQCKYPPRVWLNASTATIYRASFDKPNDEVDGELGEPAFSVNVAKAWEQSFFAAPLPQTRRVAMRSAIVMSPDRGGAFDYLLRLVRYGLGGRVGSGKQFVSWIHDFDFIRSVEFLLAHEEIQGVVNLSSSAPERNGRFMAELRCAWSPIQLGLPAPEWLLAIGAFFLRTEPELVLKSRNVIPRRLLEAGFSFHFPHWRTAAENLVERWRLCRD